MAVSGMWSATPRLPDLRAKRVCITIFARKTRPGIRFVFVLR